MKYIVFQFLNRVQVWRLISLAMLAIGLNGCAGLSSYLFYPQKHYYQVPHYLGLRADEIELKTSDGETLVNWYVHSEIRPRGTVLFLHGNGENISTHINSVAWLPAHGYNVFLLDYRGYGRSTGVSTLANALSDIEVAHQWLAEHDGQLPLFVFGQSLGGGLGITYVAKAQDHYKPVCALMIEAAPASWPQIARETMRKHWLTWLLQAPASLLTGEFDAEDHISELESLPVLLMYSQQDTIVAPHHGRQLLERATGPVTWLEIEGPHIAGLKSPAMRQAFTDFMASQLRRCER